MVSPSTEYQERLADRVARIGRLQGIDRRIGNARLALVAVAIAAAWTALYGDGLSFGWITVPVALFAGTVIYHGRVRRVLDHAGRAARFYRSGLARIEDRWAGTGQHGERFNDPHHIYAADVDLFGKAGLFELLSSARTRMGEETLARWLLAPSSIATLYERHACVAELRTRLDLREQLAVLGTGGAVAVHPERLLEWTEAPRRLTAPWLLGTSIVLPILTAAAVFVWSSWNLAAPALLVLLVEAAILIALKKQLDEALAATENGFEDLKVLSALLERLERESFVSAPCKH